MMLVVADSSPIHVLVRIGYIEILPKLFDRVLIPTQVAAELSHLHAPQVVRDFIAKPPAWLEVRQPMLVEPILELDSGEEAALSLVRETRAELLLIDEIDGRRVALRMNIPVIGTIGALERAANRGLIDLHEAFESLRQTDFRISTQLLEAARARHQQPRNE